MAPSKSNRKKTPLAKHAASAPASPVISDASYEEARIRRTLAQAELAETRNRKLIGELVDRAWAEQVIADAALVVRQGLLALSARLAPLLEGLTEQERRALIHRECIALLEKLSSGAQR